MKPLEAFEVAGVRLTNPDKVLYPEQGITKRDLANYNLAVAGWMLPHVARRPITLVRCPTGRQKKCFYQRHAGSGMPSELSQVVIAGFEESGAYIYIRNVNGLLALAQMGVLEVHPWNAHVDRPDRPGPGSKQLSRDEQELFMPITRRPHHFTCYIPKGCAGVYIADRLTQTA